MAREKEDIFSKVPEMDYTEAAAKTDFDAFKAVVESRRSVRVYTDDKIPEQVMQDCLDLALLAPNSSNLQAWEFFWVKESKKKQALVEACLSQPAARTAAELVVAVAKTNTWKDHSKEMLEYFDKSSTKTPKSAIHYYKKITKLAYNQGPFGIYGIFKRILLFVIGLKKAIPREPTSESDMKIWAHKTTALACENFMLAMRAAGYDTCPMEGMDSKRVKKILGLKQKEYITMVISAGKRAPNGIYGPRIRFGRNRFIKTV